MPYADNEKNKECKRKCRKRNREYKRDINLYPQIKQHDKNQRTDPPSFVLTHHIYPWLF